jgi:hypothetical protein
MSPADPVFRSVGQALYVAFVMEIYKGSTKGTMTFLEDWKEQRYGRTERGHNLGLTREEMEAQCALIRAAVDDHLKQIERYAIYARFGHQVRRANGVRGLCDQYASICMTANQQAVFALIWAIYAPKHAGKPRNGRSRGALERAEAEEWSLRMIERDFSANRRTLTRDQKVLRKVCGDVELLAQMRLEELFVRTGLIPDPNDA